MPTSAERFEQLQKATRDRIARERKRATERATVGSQKKQKAPAQRAVRQRAKPGSYETPKNKEKLPGIAKEIIDKMDTARRWTSWLRGMPGGR